MTIILGGGMTGLAAGMTSRCPVFEASRSAWRHLLVVLCPAGGNQASPHRS